MAQSSSSSNAPRILLLDIETLPNQAWCWGKYDQDVLGFIQESCIASFAAKWLDGPVFARSLPDYKGYKAGSYDDSALVSDLWKLLDTADIVIAHNGCVAPGTRILTANLDYVPVEQLKVGDTLFAYESRPKLSARRCFVPSVVTYISSSEKPRVLITLTDGTKLNVTSDHPFLVPNTKGNHGNWSWKFAGDFRAGDVLTRVMPTWEHDTSYEAGYLAAAVDGEGHVCAKKGIRLGFAQKTNAMFDEFTRIAKTNGFHFYETPKVDAFGVHRLILNGIFNVFRFLGSVKPKRLMEKTLKREALCMHVPLEGRTHVVSVEDGGFGPIIEMATSTGTYISEGFASHNCDFDVKVIQGRFIYHKLPPPSPFKSVDTKRLAKKVARFNSNKLDDLGELLHEGRKIKTNFDLWRGCIEGDPKCWAQMVKYNKKDVELLERIYLRLRPWDYNHPNLGVYIDEPVCPKCGSADLQYRGYAVTLQRKYQRFQCKVCGGWGRVKHAEKTNQKLVNAL